ncbi:hypothetical protein G9C98_003426 [Cotesia typhae]|uniref:Sm domain-containing protein n=1 Tax=Cotesia typhae TaxID=2053667 RepID=A0A8J5R6G3_9HYME|nr:hypothetical protein G9C98_003426 [Cotesia typhae]
MREKICAFINPNMNPRVRISKAEKFALYNNLSILLQAVKGYKTTIDLRNESYVYGTVEETDAFMNVTMKNSFFTNSNGETVKFDTLFVQSRNIRCVHIPANVRKY